MDTEPSAATCWVTFQEMADDFARRVPAPSSR
jgi:hypothetical protein